MIAGTDKHIRLTFTEDERLKSKRLLDLLFSERTFVQNPTLRIYYKQTELNCAFPAQFAFTVPKKLFPHATDRNRLKRLMRESVRLQKSSIHEILTVQNKQMLFLLSYQAKEIRICKEVDAAITQLLQRLLNETQLLSSK
ncbi:MAG: ribonuclease P protein component [Sphingobacteriales bacterium]|nr:ribonuclease P protein component [Sphingobacteriales bacterium]